MRLLGFYTSPSVYLPPPHLSFGMQGRNVVNDDCAYSYRRLSDVPYASIILNIVMHMCANYVA